MPDKVSNELLYEVLKDLQKRQDRSDQNFKEIQSVLLRVREDINGLRSDFLRFERGMASLEVDVERIESRLEFVDISDQ